MVTYFDIFSQRKWSSWKHQKATIIRHWNTCILSSLRKLSVSVNKHDEDAEVMPALPLPDIPAAPAPAAVKAGMDVMIAIWLIR